ncbi:MAG: hypothetical protein JW931_01295 [Methanomicrobiaceae archaeon]|nr:hypothetical protein [Methanomicrobiaceae archaeon]
MLSRFNIILYVLVLCILVTASLSSGCSSEESSYNATLDEIDSIEKAADDRVKIMDFTASDEIFYSQLSASESQYHDAIDQLYAIGPTPGLSGFAYETRVKSLQLKIDFLDLYSAMLDNDRRAEEIFQTSTPKFREGLIEVMDEYENIRQRILFLRVMAGDIDRNLLNPEFAGMIGIVRGELELMLESVDSKISFLMEYR